MDASQVNEVVDKLAEKVGLAADKLQPLAEQAVMEFQRMSIAQAIIGGVFMLLLPIVAWRLTVAARRSEAFCEAWEEGDTAAIIPSAVLGCLLTIGQPFAVIGCIQGILHACAPTYHCLKALMG